MDDFLLMAWGCFGGIVMFLISAVAYPYLGLPPLWLIGMPLAVMGWVLIRATINAIVR